MPKRADTDSNIPITAIHHVCFVLFGVAQLLPWNVYLKCIPYVNTLVFDICGDEGLGGQMMSTYTGINFVTMLLIVFGNVDDRVGITLGPRIAVGMLGNLLLMVIVVLATIWPLSTNPHFHYYWFLVVCGTAGFFTAFMMKGLVGMLARFPRKLTPSLQVGNAIAGLLVSVTFLLSSWLIQEGAASITIFYFGAAIILLAAASTSFVAMLWTDFSFQFYFGALEAKSLPKSRLSLDNFVEEGSLTSKNLLVVSEKSLSVLSIMKAIKWHCSGILITLFLTVSVAANLMTSPRSFSEHDMGGMFAKIYIPLVFLAYDCGDLVGRWTPMLTMPSFKSIHFLVLPFARLLLFLPIFLFFAPTKTVSHLFWFEIADSICFADVLYWSSVFAFGLSTGYLITCLLMTAPLYSAHFLVNDDPSVRERSGVLMGMFLNIGLVTGSLSYILWRFILR